MRKTFTTNYEVQLDIFISRFWVRVADSAFFDVRVFDPNGTKNGKMFSIKYVLKTDSEVMEFLE